MDRSDLQRLSREELIELVLALQRPDKTSRNSSKPPSTDKKEKRQNARPGGREFLVNDASEHRGDGLHVRRLAALKAGVRWTGAER